MLVGLVGQRKNQKNTLIFRLLTTIEMNQIREVSSLGVVNFQSWNFFLAHLIDTSFVAIDDLYVKITRSDFFCNVIA